MARNVLAIDATVSFAATCRVVVGMDMPMCGGVISDPAANTHHYLAADMSRHRAFAEKIVTAATSSRHGAPELVVLVKPQIGYQGSRRPRGTGAKAATAKVGDTSAVRRLGVHWELVRQLSDAGIPVAEIAVLTAEKTILGKAIYGSAGRANLEDRIRAMFPELVLPQREGSTDPRYRLTTVALALLGAAHIGMGTPLELDDAALVDLAIGSSFPPGLNTATAAARVTAKARRAEQHDEALAEQIAEMVVGDVEAMPVPRGPLAAAAYRRVVGG